MHPYTLLLLLHLLLLASPARALVAPSGRVALTEQFPLYTWAAGRALALDRGLYSTAPFYDNSLVASFTASFVCTGKIVLPCCADCSTKPHPDDCYCPVTKRARCVDHLAILGTVPANDTILLEMGLGPAAHCRDWAVSVLSHFKFSAHFIDGHTLMPHDFEMPLVCQEHAKRGDKALVMKAAGQDLTDRLIDFIFAVITSTQERPVLYVPVHWFWDALPAQRMRCSDGTNIAVKKWSFPSMDPALHLWDFELDYEIISVDFNTLLNDSLSFSLPMWVYMDDELETSPALSADTDVSTCVLTVNNLYTANHTEVVASVTFAPFEPVPCTAANAKRYLDAWNAMPEAISELFVVTAAMSALNASSALSACASFVYDQLLVPSKQVQASISTTQCAYSPIDSRFGMDPCCNNSLLLYMCCTERNVSVPMQEHVPADDALRQQCKTPRCAREALDSLLVDEQTNMPLVSQCDVALHAALSDPRLIAYKPFSSCPTNTLIQFQHLYSTNPDPWLRPCDPNNLADACPLNTDCGEHPFWASFSPLAGHIPIRQTTCGFSANETLLVLCEVAHLPTGLRGILAGTLGLPINASDDALAAGVVSSGQFIASNDTVPYCPWNPPLIYRVCDVDFGGDHYCATGECGAESGGVACFEVSRMPGCYASMVGGTSDDCPGGVFTSYVTERNPLNCYYPQYANITSCFDTPLCPPQTLQQGPLNRTSCSARCMLSNVKSASACKCSSAKIPIVCNAMGNLTWNSDLGICEFDPPLSSLQCALIDGEFFGGRIWQEPFLATKASCESAGLCSTDPDHFWNVTRSHYATRVYEQQECEAMTGCDLPGYDTRSSCESHGICSDAYGYGYCEYPPLFTNAGPVCQGATFPMPRDPGAFCAGDEADGLECNRTPFPAVFPDKESQCGVGTKQCALPQSSLVTSLDATGCGQCGGKMVPTKTWQSAKWGKGKWYGFQWKKRAPVVSTYFYSLPVELSNYFAYSYRLFLSSLMMQYVSCKKGQLNAVLPALVCDCLKQSEGCYDIPELRSVGVFFTCRNVEASFVRPNFALYMQNTGVEVPTFKQSIPCAAITLATVSRDVFEQPTETPFSSFFLATVRSSPYAIVNSKGVAVGEVVGDVVHLDFPSIMFEISGKIGSIKLCIRDRGQSSSLFSVPAFARWAGPQDPTTFTPAFFDVTRVNDSWCAQVNDSDYFASVMLLESWRTATALDALPRATRVLFVVAATLYGVMLCLCIARILASLHRLEWSKEILLNFSASSILALFLLFRTILFALLSSGALPVTATVRLFVFAELGTMLELTVGALTVYLWVELYHRTSGGKYNVTKHTVPAIAIIGGMLAYLFFIGICITLDIITRNTVVKSQAPCAQPAGPQPAEILDRFYKSGVALIAFALAVLVGLYGYLHTRRMRKVLDMVPYWQLVTVVVLTWIGLMLQAVLVLYIAFKAGNWVVVILGGTAELLRPAAMIFVLRSVSWRKIFCFWKKEETVQTGGSTSSSDYVLVDDDNDRSEF